MVYPATETHARSTPSLEGRELVQGRRSCRHLEPKDDQRSGLEDQRVAPAGVEVYFVFARRLVGLDQPQVVRMEPAPAHGAASAHAAAVRPAVDEGRPVPGQYDVPLVAVDELTGTGRNWVGLGIWRVGIGDHFFGLVLGCLGLCAVFPLACLEELDQSTNQQDAAIDSDLHIHRERKLVDPVLGQGFGRERSQVVFRWARREPVVGAAGAAGTDRSVAVAAQEWALVERRILVATVCQRLVWDRGNGEGRCHDCGGRGAPPPSANREGRQHRGEHFVRRFPYPGAGCQRSFSGLARNGLAVFDLPAQRAVASPAVGEQDYCNRETGVCTPSLPVGASCASRGERCVEYAMCENGVCALKPREGEECEFDSDCMGDLICSYDDVCVLDDFGVCLP